MKKLKASSQYKEFSSCLPHYEIEEESRGVLDTPHWNLFMPFVNFFHHSQFIISKIICNIAGTDRLAEALVWG